MDKFIEYAPAIIVIMGFFIAYKIFVTPQQLNEELKAFERDLDKKFVHKEVHDLAISELKEDIAEIKDKIDKIYDKIMGV